MFSKFAWIFLCLNLCIDVQATQSRCAFIKPFVGNGYNLWVSGSRVACNKRINRNFRAPTTLNRPMKMKLVTSLNEHFLPLLSNIATGSVTGSSYWITRVIFLRSLGFIYFIAFLVALNQNKQLIGNKGITPARQYLQYHKENFGTNKKLRNLAFYFPTLFWWVDWNKLDNALDIVAISGLATSFLVMCIGAANIPVMFMLWVLYHSLVTVGQTWYGFGWESQLLETGFLAIFLCPAISMNQFPSKPVPWVCIWGFRWLIFRIMIGAGLIKIRGDSCWRDLTAMDYHYETQPVPNPLSYFLHKLPKVYHRFETAMNHVVELILPWLILLPHRLSFIPGGILQIVFQIILISSGNLSFLNWLTILPAIFCLDDVFLSNLFRSTTWKHVANLRLVGSNPETILGRFALYTSQVVHFALFGLLFWRSIPVVRNLLSKNQSMNRSFDPLRILNTYGAFGSVTKQREEIIIQGTSDYVGNDTEWLEYEFKAKPGDVHAIPPTISPYHYRLDWMMWIAAQTNARYNPWIYRLLSKILENDQSVLSLLKKNPFAGKDPPKCVRAMVYLYEYTDRLDQRNENRTGPTKLTWWKRKEIGTYVPLVGLDSLERFGVKD